MPENVPESDRNEQDWIGQAGWAKQAGRTLHHALEFSRIGRDWTGLEGYKRKIPQARVFSSFKSPGVKGVHFFQFSEVQVTEFVKERDLRPK